MPCIPIKTPDGATGFACTGRPRFKRCACGSGLKADRLCDWKIGEGKTCDAAICSRCATAPAPEKDLCQAHAREWVIWKTERQGPR